VVHATRPTGEPTAWAGAQLGDLLFHTGDLEGAAAAYRESLAAAPAITARWPARRACGPRSDATGRPPTAIGRRSA
jgi:hypothetical protein